MKYSIPTIETERLTLRPLTVEDAEAVFEWAGDERVARYMIYSTHENAEVTKAWLTSLETLENEYTWGFVRKSDGKLIGSGGIRFRPDEHRWSFGYNLRFDCWNKGCATEAARAMIDHVRREHNTDRFVSECAVENIASARVIEKCGLQFAGYGEYSKLDGSRTFKCKIYKTITEEEK